MENNSIKFSIAELMILICGFVLVVAFFFLPWVGGGLDATQVTYSLPISGEVIRETGTGSALTGYMMLVDTVSEATSGLVDWTVAIFPIAAVVGIVVGGLGLVNEELRKVNSMIIATLSAVGIAYFIAFFLANNKAVVHGDLILGFGFWMTLFSSVLLAYQMLIPRPPEEISAVDLIIDLLRVLIIVIVIAGASNTILSGKFTLANYISLFIAGLAQGSIYALIALGYTLVYGILLMINFAHGEVFMAGAFTTMFLARWLDSIEFLNTYPIISVLIMIVFSSLISMIVAILLERIAYRPLRGSPRLVPLITAIGASFFLQYTFAGLYGARNYSYPNIDAFSGTVSVGTFSVPLAQLIVFFSALGLMAMLYWLVEKTKLGKAMRAVSEDKEVARLMGIDVDFIILVTFAVGGALAGSAGVINGIFRPQGVKFTMGFIPGIKAFTAAVLGGIGNVPGAMLGGLFLGVIESLGPNMVLGGMGIPGANQLKDVIAFTMLVLILIFRPQGILGERLTEKKA